MTTTRLEMPCFFASLMRPRGEKRRPVHAFKGGTQIAGTIFRAWTEPTAIRESIVLYYRSLVFLMLTSMLIAPAFAINIRTTVPAVNHEGSHEIVGNITFEVNADDFAQASPGAPIYIRFTLQFSQGWSKTLVDLRPGAPSPTDQPINLAIQPSGSFSLNPAIPASAVQLVRLIEGERSAWIRISDSSSDWIQDGIGFAPPSANQRVEFTVGVRGGNSVLPGSNTDSDGNEWPDGTLITTLLCVSYRDTPQFGVGDLDQADFLALDSATVGVEDGDSILLGNQVGIGFSNDTNIARGANYIPCFEYHFAPDSFNVPPHTIEIGRLNQASLKTFEATIPDVYFSNSSDFVWEPGSRFVLVHKDFEIWYYLQNFNYPGSYRPEPPETRLLDSDPVIIPAGEEVWQLTPLYLDNILRGYDILLLEGELGINETIALSGMSLSTSEDFAWYPLQLDAWAFYTNRVVTGNEVKELGPVTGATAILEPHTGPVNRQVIPYTAYDRPFWSFQANVVNPHDETAKVNALFYNRHGILLRILREPAMPARAAITFDIRERYGDLAAEVLSWVEIISDKPLAAAAAIEDPAQQTLDIFPAQSEAMDSVYGLHVPTDDATWDTRAYVLSSDPAVDAAFFVKYPGQPESLVDSFLFPGGTFVLDDDDFGSGADRQTWFAISSTEKVGVGLLSFFNGDQKASVNMNVVPTTEWRFPHVGNPAQGWWNGAVVVNPAETDQQVRFQGLDASGAVVSQVNRTIAAESRQVLLLTDLFTNFTSITQLRVVAPDPILSFLLLGQQVSELLTAVPGNLEAAKKHALPYLPTRGNDWVGFALINPNQVAVQATLTPYQADGTAGVALDVSLPAADKQLFLLNEAWPDMSLYTHAILEADGQVLAYALTGNAANTELATLPFKPADTE